MLDGQADAALQWRLQQGHELSAREAKVLEDRKVSFAEYESAVMRYRACVVEAGFALDEFRFSESESLYVWTIGEEALRSEAVQQCEAEFELIDALWQAQVDTANEPRREERRALIENCVKKSGHEVPAGKNYPDFMMWAAKNHPNCVDEVVAKER